MIPGFATCSYFWETLVYEVWFGSTFERYTKSNRSDLTGTPGG